jgi:hypothetical protein
MDCKQLIRFYHFLAKYHGRKNARIHVRHMIDMRRMGV